MKSPAFPTTIFLLCLGIFTPAAAQFSYVKINKLYTSIEPEEVSIAVNPINPLNLVAGANISFYYTSSDGGFTWSENRLSSTFGVWGDPCVIFDALGNAYYGHLSNPPSPGYWIDRIVVQSSTDGGQSWNAGAAIGFNPPRHQQDKDWFAADMTGSPFRNNIYAAWTQFDSYGSTNPADSSRILFSRSTDHGQTWSAAVRVSDAAGNCVDSDSTVEGAVPAVGPGGEVYLSWAGPLGIMFDKSTDGGQTFGPDVFVTTQPGGWDFNISGIYRTNGMPVTSCDAGNSPFRGNVYVQWSDQRNGVDNTDIFFIRSTDGGQSWGTVKKVNDDTAAAQQFFSWMTVDQSNGNIYVIFYDRRNTIGDATDVYVAKSADGGESFYNFKLTDSSFTPRSDVFFGDYTNIVARDGKVYPMWMRMDGTTLSVWTAIINDGTTFKLAVNPAWNMISLPLMVNDWRKTSLFPASVSDAFGYDHRYVVEDTLRIGVGYWLKFPSRDTVLFSGSNISVDTVHVSARWNLIGTLSAKVPVATIAADPPGMTASGFYAFSDSGYTVADTIRPGYAYWVKVDMDGTLILPSSLITPRAQRLRFVPDGELPPRPPGSPARDLTSRVPGQFGLEQNYPNPFNPSTVVRYQLPVSARVSLIVYDVLGRVVATLVNSLQDAGFKSVMFDGSALSSGLYYCRLTAGDFTQVRKMLLIR